uniref:ankyrin repeat and SOCS box protein 1 n=1 Tax=Ciona intestinalis TaxID=7719 RepID=UPI000180C81D|nr:ankyrin repeat and SOCS box protein 1 [Ciona intestinalis]|eukprot:XP_002126419.1 ankyrin repeat and SOCS box protein 1 [Ciona intestinalis]
MPEYSHTESTALSTDVNNNPVVESAGHGNASDEVAPPQRFNIALALAKPFKGLSSASENNLHKASRCGDCNWILRCLLQNCRNDENDDESPRDGGSTAPDINERNRLGASPLWLASLMGHADAVELLIKHGADLETEDIKGQTPLFAATKFNHVECVRILLQAGAKPDGSDTNISTPIYVTARDNYPDVMDLLISYGADVNGRHGKHTPGDVRGDYPGNLPIYMTLVYRHFECFRHLVKGGADLCLPPSLNGAGGSTSLLCGALRYMCDVRYTELLSLCGGLVQHHEEISELIRMYRTSGRTRTREETLEYLEEWNCNPMKLSDLTRIVIRHNMGQQRMRFITSLSLPKRLQDFLSLRLLET